MNPLTILCPLGIWLVKFVILVKLVFNKSINYLSLCAYCWDFFRTFQSIPRPRPPQHLLVSKLGSLRNYHYDELTLRSCALCLDCIQFLSLLFSLEAVLRFIHHKLGSAQAVWQAKVKVVAESVPFSCSWLAYFLILIWMLLFELRQLNQRAAQIPDACSLMVREISGLC